MAFNTDHVKAITDLLGLRTAYSFNTGDTSFHDVITGEQVAIVSGDTLSILQPSDLFDVLQKACELFKEKEEMPSDQNMTAVCFCNHKLANHKGGGGACGACSCHHFTEKLTETCRFCGEFLSVLTAPNDEVERVSYAAPNGVSNWAHTKCKNKPQAKAKSIFKHNPPPTTPAFKLTVDQLRIVSGILFKAGAFDPDGEVSDGDWTDEERAILVKIGAAV